MSSDTEFLPAESQPKKLGSPVQNVAMHLCPVSEKSAWIFLVVELASGVSGLGEISFFGLENGISQKLAALTNTIRGRDTSHLWAWADERMLRENDPVSQVVLSGIGQAALDARARELGVGAGDLLGGQRRNAVRAYANINRGTLDRTPEGWAVRARAAVDDGFQAIKMAPFDGVVQNDLGSATAKSKIRHGLDCLNAVRAAVGPEIAINVDCHGRFNYPEMLALLRDFANCGVHWLETPVMEAPYNGETLRKIRSRANDLGIRIAGAELVCGLGNVKAMIEADYCDVYMPDLRFCGGVQEALRMAALITHCGLEFSLHNPAGPLLDLISLQIASAAMSATMIERQYKEHPLQESLVLPPAAPPENGLLRVPEGTGWGRDLDPEVLRSAAGDLPDAVDFAGIPGAGPHS